MIALIDYGMGNLHSVAKALEKAGGKVVLVKKPEELAQASRIVLPGVGAFRDCIGALNESGMDAAILDFIASGKPFLGICLGMQVLMDASYEFGQHKGLGLIPGVVKKFPDTHPEHGFKIPHMGWNDVVLASSSTPHPVLAPLAGKQVYYVHSYYCAPLNPAHILAACSYGEYPFAAAIGRDNFIGVQFHPEKSQKAGHDLLEAFLQWKP
ncbi:MAG: imidazole glycerol phosphate synthase subunit HisH [Zetaproteobacteria bacterium CG12_big_fil_rev_8_21_14_0_65_55_1124]|nr:MAG: imidazole glycerol phosphate synthase subunit HisH [Zetaproteobacteria bacterium CG1_02_55_237]PIS19636.1 MAG: imidazole glycerol phosphate synthase subunit HisH [Zetaproteobacteria bacterium CG08_land_8_20_14_0_20_55_17]PIW41978.1 MAG: imidazole glycerol phosphate synthase subunit HisH [Zetaproteobacteria bacterium CG12_big_fil_rev_8_21_14_0_65_55_1124]PIY53856.1 MAG: imidazole glycerol phosphate synthase subunit HisH [Zetaproteobacteria bacterium CG_4_10_14_0_8_um_filter_55_43]PIZ3703